jgi:hypothetical protein
MGRALSTPSAAPAPQSRRLSARRTRRSAAVLAPSAARTTSSPSRRIVRAKIRLATLEQAMMKTNPDAASSTQSTVLALDVIWSRKSTALMLKSRLGGIRFGMLFQDGAVSRFQLGAGLFQCRAGSQPAKQLGHTMDPAGHHGRRQVVRTGHHVGDDLGFGGIRNRWFQHPDDGRRARSERFQAGRFFPAPTGRCSARWSRSDTSAPRRRRRPAHRPAYRAAVPAPDADPSPRSSCRRRLRPAPRAARPGHSW